MKNKPVVSGQAGENVRKQEEAHSSVHLVFLGMKRGFCAVCTLISSGKTHDF
jgi:hypothetical protein